MCQLMYLHMHDCGYNKMTVLLENKYQLFAIITGHFHYCLVLSDSSLFQIENLQQKALLYILQ